MATPEILRGLRGRAEAAAPATRANACRMVAPLLAPCGAVCVRARVEGYDAVHGCAAISMHHAINATCARTAISTGADGLTAMSASTCGQVGLPSRFALIARLRAWFDGMIAIAQSVAGADVTEEAPGNLEHARMIDIGADDLVTSRRRIGMAEMSRAPATARVARHARGVTLGHAVTAICGGGPRHRYSSTGGCVEGRDRGARGADGMTTRRWRIGRSALLGGLFGLGFLWLRITYMGESLPGDLAVRQGYIVGSALGGSLIFVVVTLVRNGIMRWMGR